MFIFSNEEIKQVMASTPWKMVLQEDKTALHQYMTAPLVCFVPKLINDSNLVTTNEVKIPYWLDPKFHGSFRQDIGQTKNNTPFAHVIVIEPKNKHWYSGTEQKYNALMILIIQFDSLLMSTSHIQNH